MTQPSRIRTPLYQHWNNFRMGILPILCFFLWVGMTMWLWQRQQMRGNLVGELEAVRVDILAEGEGLLVAPGQGSDVNSIIANQYCQLFEPVAKGQIIARIDDSLLKAELKTIEAEIGELTADLRATASDVQVRLAQLGQDFDQDRVQRTVEVEQYELDLAKLTTEMTLNLTERNRIKASLDILNKAKQSMSGSVAELQIVELSGQLESEQKQLESKMIAREKTIANLTNAQKRVLELPASPRIPETDTMLTAITEARKLQEGKLDLIQVQIEHLVIRSPMDGVIAAIYQYPGMAVQPGTPIVSIAKSDSEYILSYVREKQRARPREGQSVTIRFQNAEYQTRIMSVGPQIELVPIHQLRDPTRPEWAIPIKIEKPKNLSLRPGELVPVIFHEGI